MQNQFSDNFLRAFRFCANCGSKLPSTGRTAWLCPVCEDLLQAHAYPVALNEYPFPVRSLYRWSHAHHRFFQRIIYSLKGGGPLEIFFPAAADVFLLEPVRAKNLFLIPSPRNREALRPDHAERFAEALARVSGGGYLPVLERTSSESQKKKTKRAREAAGERFRLLESVDAIQAIAADGALFVFVDDLITSGATAQAAYNALGRPKSFEVWTLFHRPPPECRSD